MKAILISIKPQHLVNILNGKKSIEVRKNKALASAIENLIQEEGYATIYVHCSKENHHLVKPKDYDKYLLFTKGAIAYSREHTLNGKVVCTFKCYKEETIRSTEPLSVVGYYTKKSTIADERDLLEKSCLSFIELDDYLKGKNGYAIHISNLIIFDTPKQLSEFNTCNKYGIPQYEFGKNGCNYRHLTRAPQNFAYVEVLTYN